MYYRILLVIITICVSCAVIPSIAAEDDPLTVSTSKDIYYKGDTIVVYGKILNQFGNVPVTIQIFHGDNLITVDQINVALDGTFATDFTADGHGWKEDGTYTIRVFYTTDRVAEKTFQFFREPTDTSSKIFPVNIPNSGSFDLGYSIIGGEINDITLDQDNYSLLVAITPNSNGHIILKLPTKNIDAKTNDGGNEIFITLIQKGENDDFVETQYEEIETGPDFRTLSIQFEEDDKLIQIIGTYVIPEFGTIVTMILLIAITTTIMLSKSKFSVRYN